jgi:predicted TIM-barrel fold metal-dependent hydrolase
MKKILTFIAVIALISCSGEPGGQTAGENKKQESIADLKLADYRPNSIYVVPRSDIAKAAFPAIDIHSHDYAQSKEEIDQWVQTMDRAGILKTVILSYQTGAEFDRVVEKYAAHPERFDLWCGIDYTGYDTDEHWVSHAIKELERCHTLGAKGVGELGDKGEGLLYSKPTPGYGLHLDDPRLQPIWEKCAELNMPVNIHVAEPIWMYEPMDSTNDGLMNAWTWRVDMTKEGILDHGELMTTLENAVSENPNTTFIACHFANCSYNTGIVAQMLDKYPNLYVDNSARYAETAPIPRHMQKFYERYQDRILYGTDMGMGHDMYAITFRILESEDEHFYEAEQFGYHWPLNGFGLSEEILEKLYYLNAQKILNQ